MSHRLCTLIKTAAIAAIALAPAQSTVLFKPVAVAPKVLVSGSTTMSKPLTGTALRSPKVYFVFVGVNFLTGSVWGGTPTAATQTMITDAQAILNSSYLSGLAQYGGDGHATFGAVVFNSLDPTLSTWNGTLPETVLRGLFADPSFTSWVPPGTGCQTSPIYVVVHYANNTGDGTEFHGHNSCEAISDVPGNINVVSVGLNTAPQVDQFTFILTHELAEIMSGGVHVIGLPTNQICDGEPEGNDYYEWYLNGTSGPLVTAYWSFLDQAFIIPNGNLDRVEFVPVWNNGSFTHNFLSLQQGTLYQITTYPNKVGANPPKKVALDSSVQAFVVNLLGGTAQIFDLTAAGEVKSYNSSTGSWNALTLSSFVATALVSTSYNPAGATSSATLTDGQVYILSGKQAWQYVSGTWSALPQTGVTAIAAANGHFYEMVNPASGNPYIVQDGSATISPSKASVISMATAADTLYMLAKNSYQGIWQFNNSTSSWVAVTDSTTPVYSMTAAGEVLVMQAGGSAAGGGISGAAEYGLSGTSWVPLVGSNTYVAEFVVQDGSELYMLAANNGGAYQIWQYSTPGNWTALTNAATTVIKSASVDTANNLHMVASISGGAMSDWVYGGTPLKWALEIALPGK
jgi:hypothetical protein